MNYILIVIVSIVLIGFIYVQFVRKNNSEQMIVDRKTDGPKIQKKKPLAVKTVDASKETFQREKASETFHKIQNEKYARYILAKNTTESYLLQMIKEFGELFSTDKRIEHSFGIAQSENWYVVKVDPSVNFYTYHNLVGWFTGYEDNSAIPEQSIGFAKHKNDSQQDYVFYLDPDNSDGDTEIGVFRNNKSLMVYLPEAFEDFGNLKISDSTKLNMNEILRFISDKGFDVKTIESLDFDEHKININE